MALRLLAGVWVFVFGCGSAFTIVFIHQCLQEQVDVVLGPLKAADGFFVGLVGVAKKVLDGLDEDFNFVAHDVFFQFRLVSDKANFLLGGFCGVW